MKLRQILLKASAVFAVSLALNSLVAQASHAHARWVIPSHTVVSGDKPMAISLDYSISNDIFHPDIAIGGKSLSSDNNIDNKGPMAAFMSQTKAYVKTPSGKQLELESINLGRKTSTFFTANEPGTYSVEVVQPAIDVTLYKTAQGESQRMFGTYDAVKSKLPEGSTSIESLQFINRIQTFVTHNEISAHATKPTNKGFELQHTSHPNELFANESSTYALIFNGKPVTDKQNCHIKITKSGTRFRNQRNTIEPSITKSGVFQVVWPEAGFYLMEVEYELASKNAKKVFALFLTVEVHPE